MKTKVLVWKARNEGTKAEDLLNEWLAQNPNLIIKNVSQSESGEVLASYRITYTIWYEEPK